MKTVSEEQREITETLESMGLKLTSVKVSQRNDGMAGDWDKAASHYHCTLRRKTNYPGEVTADVMVFFYSQGSAHTAPPVLCDVMYSLTMDAEVLDYYTFEEWASNCGYDEDSRKAEAIYKACQDSADQFAAMFGRSEREQLQQLFQDY